MAQSSTQSTLTFKEPHERFYLIDDFVVLEVESTLFRLPAFILRSNSPKLKQLIGNNQGPSPTRRIELKSISVIDFERFLLVLLPAQAGEYEVALPGEWASVLKIANVLDFPAIRKLAMAQLESVASPIDRIVLGRKYEFSKLVASGYVELCQRKAPITLLEGHSLGMSDVIDISSIRHHLRSGAGGAETKKDSVLEICSEPGRQVLEHNAVADFIAATFSETGNPPLPSLPDPYVAQLPSPPIQAVPFISAPPSRTSGRAQPAKSLKAKSHKDLAKTAWKVNHQDASFDPFWRRIVTSSNDQRFWTVAWERAKGMDDQQVDAYVRTKPIQDLFH
ncbi:hypothetical protein BDN72DRAFT_848422 [Pluteus cervinus]|uniref:Uncharacterized protein n=1 Tax=Pluteus cervinus TaxID=181527 RepID=A0ACD3AAI4_9AGAR|nr:hypothetical protein BDN72DRAFT_848422 [Pluteus cervinus]